MDSNRKTAIIVGVLFITATVSSITALSVIPNLADPDYLINFSANENQVIIGVLLQVILAAAVIGIPVMMFPILKKHHEGLAVGYFGFRIIEAILGIGTAISLLSLLTLSREFVTAGAPAASYFQTLGTLLLAGIDWLGLLGIQIFFGLSVVILNYLLYTSKLIPRFISVWGLIAGILLIAAGPLGMFGISPESTLFLALPIAVNEMVLAIWLIVKGFKTPTIASESAKIDTNKA